MQKSMMQYAIGLYFDQETEKKLCDLAQTIAGDKISTKLLDGKQGSILRYYSEVNK